MAGFFDKVTGLYDQAWNTLQADYAKAMQQMEAEHGKPGTPEFRKRTMEEALNFAPLGITAYHGTLSGALDGWKPGTHFGTTKAAMSRLAAKIGLSATDAERAARVPHKWDTIPDKLKAKLSGATIYPVDIPDDKILKGITDNGVNDIFTLSKELLKNKVISMDEFKQFSKLKNSEISKLFDVLKNKGYAAIEYVNEVEGLGTKSYYVIDPKQVKGFFTK